MELFENLGKIFNVSLIYATFRASTPIIYAALCVLPSLSRLIF